MLEVSKTLFAAGRGLMAAVLSFALLMGLADAVSGIVKTARMRPRTKRHLED